LSATVTDAGSEASPDRLLMRHGLRSRAAAAAELARPPRELILRTRFISRGSEEISLR
jgi:hypothetical protein